MHELSVALSLLTSCRACIAERGGGRLTRVRIALGELAGVEPALLATAWDAAVRTEAPEELVAGDPATVPVLAVDWIPAVRTCPDCGPVEGDVVGSWLCPCPRCGLPLSIEGGDELDVVELEYESLAEALEVTR